MKVLGIYDWHNCGCALVDDMRIVAAVEEERLSRSKVGFGMPARAIDCVLHIGGASWDQIDAVAVCGVYDPTPLVRWRQRTFQFERKINTKWWIQYRLWKIYSLMRGLAPLRIAEKWMNQKIIYAQLKRLHSISPSKIFHVDHYVCHASAAYRTSGFDKAIILVMDGSGDGYSTTVFLADQGELTLIEGAKEAASLGKFYANATLGLGFRKLTGEGKVMGLAGYGDPRPYYPHVEKVLWLENCDGLALKASEDLIGNGWALKVRKDAKRFRREDIAAAVQRRFEEIVVAVVGNFLRRCSADRVVLVGGAAMNVKMNQRVREMSGVRETFVFPAMTDSGVASGAALEVCHRLLRGEGRSVTAYRLKDVHLGPSYTNEEIKSALDRRGYGGRAQ